MKNIHMYGDREAIVVTNKRSPFANEELSNPFFLPEV
jgi:hypothetical protein